MRKVALVTGGARGIGLGIAECLGREGFDLAVCGTKDANQVTEHINILKETGANILYCKADVSDKSARSKMLEEIRSKFGRLNVLVNNAGVAPLVRTDILEASEESYERVMKINLQGPYFLTQSVAKWMIEQKNADSNYEGCIINISSISATVASVARGEYCISKAGISMATKLWAVRLSEFGIPVYEVRPGIINTDMTAAVKEKYDKLIAEGLLLQKRWGEAQDVGKAVAMLTRGDLAYSTGQVINVDGGFSIERL
ncbi:MAG: 3-ketoacyl-ACP reductase [Candidatus Nanoarchaeia archaeon]